MTHTEFECRLEIFLAEQGMSSKTVSDAGKPFDEIMADFYNYLIICGDVTRVEVHFGWATQVVTSTKGKRPGEEFMHHAYAIYFALCAMGVHCGALPFGKEKYQGLEGVVFEEDPAALALEINIPLETWGRLNDEDRLERYTVTDEATGDRWDGISLKSIMLDLAPYANHPTCRAYDNWINRNVVPALVAHGWYDPELNHETPIGAELDAIETRERMRDCLDGILPGLGTGMQKGLRYFRGDADGTTSANRSD
jgi:hypothetical protein